MRTFLLTAIVLFTRRSAQAQIQRGAVLAEIGQTPVANATITAKRSKTAATSDRLGRFSIPITVLPDTVITTAIGFAPDTSSLDALASKPHLIALRRLPVVISDLIAIASAEKSLDLSSHGRWEMPIEAARGVPAAVETDVYRALALVPAVSFTSPLSARPMIRGYDAQEVATRIDGFEIINLFHLGRMFSAYPPDAASEIGVTVAPYTSANGGSIAGIIDIVGRTGPTGQVDGGGGLSFGSLSAYLGGGNQRIRTFGALRFFHLGALNLIPGVELPYHFEDLYSGVVFGPADRPTGRITLFATQDRAGNESRDNFLNWNNLVLGSRWRLLDRASTTFELSASVARFQEKGHDVPGLRTLGSANLFNQFSRVGVNGELVHHSAKTRFAAGFGLGWRTIDNQIATRNNGGGIPSFQQTGVDFRGAELSGYTEVTRRVGPFALEAAVRGSTAGAEVLVEPRLHARWTLDPRVELSAGIGRTGRLYHLLGDARSEPDFDFLDFWMNAGDSVPVALVDHATLDLNIDVAPIVARLSAYLSHGAGIGEVRPAYDQVPRQFDFFRFGRSRTRGIEAQIGYRGDARHPHSVSLSYAYTASQRNWGDEWVAWAQDRRHQLRLFGQIQHKRLTVLLAIDGASGPPATAANFEIGRGVPGLPERLGNPFGNQFPVFGRENAVATSGTVRVDAGFNLTLGNRAGKRAILGLGIINLLQGEIAPITNDARAEGPNAIDQNGKPTLYRRLFRLPGVPTLTLRIEF